MSDQYTPEGVHYAPSADFLSKRSGQMGAALRMGRIPPQALEMEQCVLGAIINVKKSIEKVEDVLTPEMMYKEGHRIIYEAALEMRKAGIAIDTMTVAEFLRGKGMLEAAGGMYYLMELGGKMGAAAHIEQHCTTIIEKFRKREAIAIGDKLVNEGFDETIPSEANIEAASEALTSIVVGGTSSLRHMPETHLDGVKRIEANMRMRAEMLKGGKPVMLGIPSGIHELDAVTKGWRNGHLIIKAAMPGVGKTSGACGDAIAAANAGAIVAFFSLEMTEEELHDKIIGAKAGISPTDIAEGNVTVNGLSKIQAAWSTTKGIHIDDKPGIDLRYIRAEGRKLRVKYPDQPLLIIIDYLQLMGNSENVRGRSREQEVAEISKGLKKLAKQLKCPIIALSQMSRAIEMRGGDKKPLLSDLRESGAIEQDADIVMFYYRASMHGITEYEDGTSTKGTGEFLLKKHRGGPLKDITVSWEPWCRGWVNPGEALLPPPSSMTDEVIYPEIKPNLTRFSEPKHSEEQPASNGGNGDFFPF